MRCIFIFLMVIFVFWGSPKSFAAPINLNEFGMAQNQVQGKKESAHLFDSTINSAFQLANNKKQINFLSKTHPFKHSTTSFYILLALCAILGIIKTIHPKYFNDLWRAFSNPILGNRQLKENIQSAFFPNILMNLFACIVLGIYVYYLLNMYVDLRFTGIPNGLLASLLMIGAVLLYLFKHLFIGFTGWVFNISAATEQYQFNVFLVNKILGITLLPFILFFAFLNKGTHLPLTIISLFLTLLLLLNRYMRSWNVFGQMFQNSRFHFFMYLCAFEIMPMAVLMKMILRIL